jgi:adenylate cyclase
MNWRSVMDKKERSFRFDFVQEILSIDEDTKTVHFRLTPNPDRYEWKEDEKGRFLYDKFDKMLIPADVYRKALEQLKEQPVYYQPPLIEDSFEYIKSRIPAIKRQLSQPDQTATFVDKSDSFLSSLETNRLNFVILSVDLVKSTRLSTSIDIENYAKLISVLINEISNVIPLFHGYVLKYTGDGLIAYFAEPSFISKNDLAMDCSMTIRALVYYGINPLLKKAGIDPLEIRIGLDAGEAMVAILGSITAKRHLDLLGAVINLATKIQSLAPPGDVLLGRTVETHLHTDWRKNTEEVHLPESWEYRENTGKLYKVFRMKLLEKDQA